MSESTSKTIGLILPTVSNYFGHTLIEAFEHELSGQNCRLTVALTNHDVDKEKDYLQYFSKTCDGIMIISDAQYYDMLGDKVPDHVPVIFLNRKPMECSKTAIIENDYAAVYQAVSALMQEGHKNISLICRNPDFSTTKEILRAYQTVMENSPIGFHEEWVHFFDGAPDTVPDIVDEMKEYGCTAFFTASQTLTERFLDYLFLYNTREDDHLSLAGFANTGMNTSLQNSIDMVAQPIDEFVILAAHEMLELIAHPDTPVQDHIVKGTFRKRLYEPFSLK